MRSWLSLRNSLIACVIVLGCVLGIQTDWGRGLAKPEVTLASLDSKHEAIGVLPDFNMNSEADAYAQITAKPLLNPSRKPAPVEIVQVAVEPAKPRIRRGLYQLTGITDLGNKKYAIVKEVSNSLMRRVKVGDSLQELKVKEISATAVVLEFMGETEDLQLAKFTVSGRSSPPAPLPTPAAPVARATVARPVEGTQQRAPTVTESATSPIASPAASANPATVASPPRTTPDGRQIISVGELLERRRLEREQQRKQ